MIFYRLSIYNCVCYKSGTHAIICSLLSLPQNVLCSTSNKKLTPDPYDRIMGSNDQLREYSSYSMTDIESMSLQEIIRSIINNRTWRIVFLVLFTTDWWNYLYKLQEFRREHPSWNSVCTSIIYYRSFNLQCCNQNFVIIYIFNCHSTI